MNKYLFFILLWLSLYFAPTTARGQVSKLTQLWNGVESNYPGISSRQFDVEAAQENERFVKSKALPQTKLQAQNTFGTFEGANGGFFPQAGFFNVSAPISTTGSNVAASTFVSGTMELEIYGFGRQRAENRAAGSLASKSALQKESYLLGLKKELSTRYIYFLYNASKLNMAVKNGIRLEEINKIASSLSRSGLLPVADSLLAHSSYIQSMADKDRWTGKSTASRELLDELYGGRVPDTLLTLGKFVTPEAVSIDHVGLVNDHPYISVLEKEADYLSYNSSAVRKAALPSFKLLAGYAFRGSGIDNLGNASGRWSDGFNNNANNVLVGLGLTWNITSILSNRHQANSFDIHSQSISNQVLELKANILANLKGATAIISQQFKELRNTELAVQQASTAYEMYLSRYKNGLISMSDLLQTRFLLEQAEDRQLEATLEYWLQVVRMSELNTDFTFLFNKL